MARVRERKRGRGKEGGQVRKTIEGGRRILYWRGTVRHERIRVEGRS